MILRRLTIIITFLTAWVWSNGQQINAVPDYVFRNQMSVGRNAVTDTAAYFSIGPRYGATKGMMPPIVVDTAIFSGSKRNGLLIFSVQKNKFLYWDSVRVQWSDMAGSSGSYIVAGDTASMLSPYVRHAGYGLTKSGQSFLVDTLNIATRAWRQKGLDSLAALEVSGSGTTNYIPKFTASSTIGNSLIFDNGTNVGIGTASPGVKLDIVGSAGTIVRTKGGTGSAQGSAYYVQLAGSTNTLSAFGDRANIFGGTVDQIASIYTGSGIPLTFDVNAAERLRIFANGRVGINTTTDAGYQLDVNGTLRSVNGANFATTSGQVGIGKTSPSAKSKLDVEGNIDIADGSFYYYRNTVANTGAYGMYYSNTAPKYPIRLAVNADPTNNRFFEIGWHKNDNKDSTWNPTFSVNSYNAETFINTTSDAGDYKLQVSGNIYNTGSAVLAATSGEAYIGTTSDAGNYKLQVSGQAFIRNTATSGALYLDSTSLSIYEVKNRHAILISGHSLTGAEIQGPIYVGTNWNTSSDVSAIEVALTNTASGANSNLMKLSDGTNTFRVTKDAGIFTAAPSGGTARKWKLGSVVATTVILDTANYVEVEINGVAYKLALATPN